MKETIIVLCKIWQKLIYPTSSTKFTNRHPIPSLGLIQTSDYRYVSALGFLLARHTLQQKLHQCITTNCWLLSFHPPTTFFPLVHIASRLSLSFEQLREGCNGFEGVCAAVAVVCCHKHSVNSMQICMQTLLSWCELRGPCNREFGSDASLAQ